MHELAVQHVGLMCYQCVCATTDPIGQTTNHTYIKVVFYSSVIEDASHPSCTMLWDYSYLMPTIPMATESLLPGCFVMDSREGYHMTYYWFHALDWTLKN